MPSIMIFDSGAGGLSIASEIYRQAAIVKYHSVTMHYMADDLYFPYGELAEQEVHDRIIDWVLPSIDRIRPDIFVVACNTASTVVLPLLRQHLTIPVVGVVPAIKPAATHHAADHIGLLATPATISRTYTDNLIQQFAPNTKVTKVGSTALVQMAEDFLLGKRVSIKCIADILSPFFKTPAVDTIVLGCTHFPLLRSQITQAIQMHQSPDTIQLVDSGEAVSRRVLDLLEETGCRDDSAVRSSVVVYTSGIQPDLWRRKAQQVLGSSFPVTVEMV